MEGHQWEHAPSNAENVQRAVCIKHDVPPVLIQENSIKFRSFCPIDDERWGNHSDDSEFRVYKRRRFDAALDYQRRNGCREMCSKPFLRRFQDAFEISQRQYQTLQWILIQNPSSEKIFSRFALDRALGVPPSLSCIHKVLRILNQHCLSSDSSDNSPFITLLLEDIIMDEIDIGAQAVRRIIHDLLSHPVHAARVALTLGSTMSNSLYSLPAALWSELCLKLAENSRHFISSCTEFELEDYVRLFCKVVELVRLRGESIGEVTFAAFGLGLLLHRRHICKVIALVAQELFSGRNRPDSHQNPVVVSAFLSKLICAYCEFELSCAGSSTSSRKKLNKKQLSDVCVPNVSLNYSPINFLGDVIQFAAKRSIQLSSSAFDSLLEFCDVKEEYFTLCVFFSASCAMSIPTLRSFLRFVEVLHDFPKQLTQAGIRSALCGSRSSFLLWFFKKNGEEMWNAAHSSRHLREPELLYIFDLVGKVMCREREFSSVVELFFVLRRYTGPFNAFFPVASYYLLWRNLKTSGLFHLSEIGEDIASSNALSKEGVDAILDPTADLFCRGSRNDSSVYTRLLQMEKDTQSDNPPVILLRTALQNVIGDPKMYCNILTTQCLNVISESTEYTMAFVRMMADYRTRSGAVVVMPMDNLLPHVSGLTEVGRKLALQWHGDVQGWFIILPLFLSAQLDGHNPLCVSFDLFRRVQLEHQRVMLIGGNTEEVELAIKQKLQPVIAVVDLMKKLLRK